MSSDSPIFRKIALERLSTPEQLDQALMLASSSSRLAVWTAVAVVAAIVAAGILVTVPITAKGVGILLDSRGLAEVTSTTGGRVAALAVQPGDALRPGDLVATVAQNDQASALDTLRAERADQESQRARIVDFHVRDEAVQTAQREQRRRELTQRAAVARQRLAWMREREQQDQTLLKNGFISRNKLQDTQTERLSLENSLNEIDSQLRALEVEAIASAHARKREVLDYDLRIAAFAHRINEMEKRLARDSRIDSQVEGKVVELKVVPGDVIAPGQAVAAVAPSGQGRGDVLTVVAFLPPGEAKKAEAGMQARVIPGNVKKEEFGAMAGRVRAIAPLPATPEGMQRVLRNRQLVQTLSQNAAPIEVVVDLEMDPARPSGVRWTSRGPDMKIEAGTTVDVEIVVKRMRLLTLALPALERWLAVSATP